MPKLWEVLLPVLRRARDVRRRFAEGFCLQLWGLEKLVGSWNRPLLSWRTNSDEATAERQRGESRK